MDNREADFERTLGLGRPEPRSDFVEALTNEIRRDLWRRRRPARGWRVAIVAAVTAIGIAALGGVGAMGSATSALADAARITFSPKDEVHLVLNSAAQDEYGQPSVAVQNVVISSAARGGTTASGSFTIMNASSGENTVVNLEWVTLEFESILPGGSRQSHTASCTTNPDFPETLAPDESKTFTFSCTISPAVPSNANELKVTVSTKAESRDKIYSSTGGITF